MELELVFGVTGRKGHGKDTFCQFVKDIDDEFQILHFAEELKNMSSDIFGLTHEQLYNPQLKEIPFVWYGQKSIYIDDYLDRIKLATGLNVKPGEKVARTPRELLQYFGTEYVRSIDDLYWVNRVIERIKTIGKKCLVADLRFPNEVEALREIGATLIRIQRPDLVSDGPVHASEAEIDTLEVDHNFEIYTGKLDVSKTFAQYLVGGYLTKKNALDFQLI